MARQKMTDADREQYGGPEWLDLQATLEWLDDQDYDTLADLEKQLRQLLKSQWTEPVTLLGFVTKLVLTMPEIGGIAEQRAKLWLMLRREGVDIALADFKPHVFQVQREPKPDTAAEADDAVPPSDSPESSPASTPADQSPPSETSTSGSTPGSPATGS